MFQPARPPEMWSRDAKRRATWKGASKVVEAVAIRPMRRVHMASADSKVKGSKEVTVWLRFRASTGMFRTARWSAMKKASNLPRSRVWMQRCMWPRLKLASGQAPG